MLFKKNVSFVDQLVRAILIVDLLVPCLLGLLPTLVVYLFSTLSFILAIGCVTRYCFIYDLFKFSTRENQVSV
ncbi:DUF2892 domain-containing protein [Spirosoma sp. KCTC 42546]|uniref:YgaP-like transmembrane domain n=1 Tax=Spirosoma sp. KCTC 42546 TaxID=2520506 RepID=UPI00115BD9F8|nr:YgaP-like transmembrane domain [Spirosoma sp. KCTC 42546]QDK79422.1 DUF2892 domain-containing protein [Spirosoma sp. KCTC 42546]